MQKIFFTCGPTHISTFVKDCIKEALNNDICSLSHRSDKFSSIYQNTIEQLKILLKIPKSSHIFFVGSATECMEIIISNLVNQNSFHIVNGAFSQRFYSIAGILHKITNKVEVEYGSSIDMGNIFINNEAEVVCITQNETSTGVVFSKEEINKLKNRYIDKIFAVDIVSSTPSEGVDFTSVDCGFFSVQKGFGLPAGLGILVVNQKCLDKAYNNRGNITNYLHSLPVMYEKSLKFQTVETPNVLAIYLLGRMCEFYNNMGVDKIREETEKKAELIYSHFDNSKIFQPFIFKIKNRSKTTITIECNDSSDIVDYLLKRNFIVSSGYGKFKNSQIRISNFPFHSISSIHNLLSSFRDYELSSK